MKAHFYFPTTVRALFITSSEKASRKCLQKIRDFSEPCAPPFARYFAGEIMFFNFLKISPIFLLLLFSVSITFAQSNVLVSGNPPLTQADFESIAEYYERGLNIEFSGRQRAELQAIIARIWRKAQKTDSQSLSKWLVTISKINGIGGEKREKIKDELREAVLGDLRSTAGSELSVFVLGVYENQENSESSSAQTENSEEKNVSNNSKTASNGNSTEDFKPIEGAIKMSDLTGKWVKGSVASYGYRNTVTNDYRSGYGAANQHDIYAGGNFDYTNYAQISGYGCTTELFTSMKGRVSISGSEVTFTYVSGTVKGKDSCKSEGFTRPAQINKATYRLERRKDGLQMCEVGKENPYCLYKAKE